ncbi:MAG TPA: chemotaxis-specific protein-glutamate methyltransferase CheB [Candidatus Dormibacteraeota bacterium]|nr:chemotaxis-specific protein-glutamate methyltransferase CheB [Candidatus Dormibacteraeota bacterium]
MRILIAEDDEALGKFVRQGLESEHYTVDVCKDGEQAQAAATGTEYDLVILDLNLPKVDGVSILRHLRLKKPSLPVLILTQRTRVEDRVQCLDTGADDYVPKQLSAASLEIIHIRADLIAKIRAAAHSHRTRLSPPPPRKPAQSVSLEEHLLLSTSIAVAAIGVSTGGPKALEEILPCLPADLPVPILIVQHMPAGFTGPFAQRLNNLCSIHVHEAIAREPLCPGVAYIAPAGVHMRVASRLSDSHPIISLDPQPQDSLHIPSIDVLMSSVAELFHKRAMGVIMTGMGSDGSEGMKAIFDEGGLAIGQDQATCAVYGMPRACAELGILSRVVPLAQIPAQIVNATHMRRHA